MKYLGWKILGLGILGILTGLFLIAVFQLFAFGLTLILISGYALSGIRTVQQQNRLIVEMFGKYLMTLQPGLQWILPGIMKVRAFIEVWEFSLPLFEQGIKVDFSDGSASPKNAEVFIAIKSPDVPYSVKGDESRDGPYRAIYRIADWRASIKDVAENALRTYLNRLTIDEAITMQKAGFDLVNRDPKKGIPNEELEKLIDSLASWGWELKRITVGDFDLEPELVQARGEVQVNKKKAESAMFVKITRAQETVGTLIGMMAEIMGVSNKKIQEEIRNNPSLRRELNLRAQEMITRRMSIDGNALTDVRIQGGDDLSKGLMAIITAIKKA